MLAIAGSFVCCSVVILFVCVVLLCVLFESFKVVGVVWCGHVVIIARSIDAVLVWCCCRAFMVLWITYSLIIVLWID